MFNISEPTPGSPIAKSSEQIPCPPGRGWCTRKKKRFKAIKRTKKFSDICENLNWNNYGWLQVCQWSRDSPILNECSLKFYNDPNEWKIVEDPIDPRVVVEFGPNSKFRMEGCTFMKKID